MSWFLTGCTTYRDQLPDCVEGMFTSSDRSLCSLSTFQNCDASKGKRFDDGNDAGGLVV